jgi:uncharacterized protein with LGFP repeats
MKRYVGRTERVMLVAAASCMLAFGASKMASACDVYLSGAIGVKWTAIGGNSSYEGPCVDNEHDDGVGNYGWIEQFQNGHINWAPGDNQAYAVHGLIDGSWMVRGGPRGYGQAVSDEMGLDACPSCRISKFYVQSINMYTYLVYNPGDQFDRPCGNPDHVCGVYGDIGRLWADSVNDLGQAGPPLGEEFWNGIFRMQYFQNVYIKWNSQTLNTCAYYYDGTLDQGTNPSACCFVDGPGCG